MNRYQRVEKPKAETPIDFASDMWEPLEEGLLPLETTRHVSMITITLSKKGLHTSSVGYQPPLLADQVKEFIKIDPKGDGSPNGRGRGRSGKADQGVESMRTEAGIAIVVMVRVEVKEEDVVSETMDVKDTMDLRSIGWKMMATIMKPLPKIEEEAVDVEDTMYFMLIGWKMEATIMKLLPKFEDVDVDVENTMELRWIGWKMEATIIKPLPKIEKKSVDVEDTIDLRLIGWKIEATIMKPLHKVAIVSFLHVIYLFIRVLVCLFFAKTMVIHLPIITVNVGSYVFNISHNLRRGEF